MKKFFQYIEDDFCAIILGSMTVLTCVNVFARYVLKSSMPFVEELTTVGLVILSLMGAAVAAKRGAHLGLTVLTEHMPQKWQTACTLLGHALGVVLGVLMLYYGYHMSLIEKQIGLRSVGMQWPEWIYAAFVPISGLVLIIRYVQLFIKDMKSGKEN